MQSAKILLIGILLGGIFSLHSCIEEEPKIVPDVYVDFTIQLDLPQYNALNSINNAIKEPNRGYDNNGVIVYRYTLDEYLAFDATCPRHVDISTSVNLDDGGFAGTATCPHCNTTYLLANLGYPDSGYPLKRYLVTISGRSLRITN
jgi:hypothetical protein